MDHALFHHLAPNMSQLAGWPTAAAAPSCLTGHCCQSLCSIANAPPLTSENLAEAPPPARFSSKDPASDWLMGYTPLQPESLKCVHCGTQSAPLWRREATGGHLCNGCNLQERSDDRPLLRPKRRAVRETRTDTHTLCHTHSQPSQVVTVLLSSQLASQQRQSECATCGTSTTSLWRRSPAGQLVCNACGLYYKLHQVTHQLLVILT